MKEILNNLEELRKLSGNNQISYLESIKSDLLKEILEYTYDTHKKYKIDEGKFDKFYNSLISNRSITHDDWLVFKTQILGHLSAIKSAKDEDVKDVCEYLYNFDLESQQFLKMVLFKDLRINMNIKKFQKVWPDFLVEPQVQLAQKFEGKSFSRNRYSRKLDGLRCYYLNNVAMTRTNKEHKPNPLSHITEQISQISGNYVYDGEVIYLNPDGTEDFKKAISLCRSDDRVDDCNNLYYVIFDMIKKDKFLSKEPDIPFDLEQIRMIRDIGIKEEKLSWYTTPYPNLLLIKQVDDSRLNEMQKARVDNNWEGLMLRDGDSCYEYKRTNKLLKIKEMQDTEVKLIGMELGTGKYENTLGKLITDYNGFELKIGSGLSDEQRDKYWNNKDNYIGKYVKVKYFEKTENQQGGQSLRFPIFICFRDPITMEEYI